jgi:hypothetical protein
MAHPEVAVAEHRQCDPQPRGRLCEVEFAVLRKDRGEQPLVLQVLPHGETQQGIEHPQALMHVALLAVRLATGVPGGFGGREGLVGTGSVEHARSSRFVQ